MTGPAIPENQTRNQLVNNLDVVATIEELAGVTPGRIPDGHSLAPLFESADSPWRSALLVEGGHAKRSTVASGSWLDAREEFFSGADREHGARTQPNPKQFSAVRTMTRKYIESGDGFEELYDLTIDPYELDNKAHDPAYASDLAELRKTLQTLESCAGKSCWAPERSAEATPTQK